MVEKEERESEVVEEEEKESEVVEKEEKVSEVEEYRNTAGNRSQPATVCRPRPRPSLRVSKRICPPIIGPVTTARWPLTQACQSQKSSQPPPF